MSVAKGGGRGEAGVRRERERGIIGDHENSMAQIHMRPGGRVSDVIHAKRRNGMISTCCHTTRRQHQGKRTRSTRNANRKTNELVECVCMCVATAHNMEGHRNSAGPTESETNQKKHDKKATLFGGGVSKVSRNRDGHI